MLELDLLKYLLLAATLAGVSAYVVASVVKILFLNKKEFKDYGDWD